MWHQSGSCVTVIVCMCFSCLVYVGFSSQVLAPLLIFSQDVMQVPVACLKIILQFEHLAAKVSTVSESEKNKLRLRFIQAHGGVPQSEFQSESHSNSIQSFGSKIVHASWF